MASRPEPTPGLVVVDKPAGWTSHDVVARMRRLAGTRKVGHAGTLDPMATGLLVVGVGRATRLLGHLALGEKSYRATIRLGESTTTDDAEGLSLGAGDTSHLAEADVRARLETFRGTQPQVPAAVSAIKVDGKRAHQRVRDGEQVALEAREVTVHEMTVHDVRRVELFTDVDVTVRVSSGFYVRSLARDLGFGLGVGGHLTALRRTTLGPFALEDAHTLDALGALREADDPLPVLTMARATRAAFPALDLDTEQAAAVRVGRRLGLDLGHDETTAVFAPDGDFLALYARHLTPEGEPEARPVAVFVG
ncbi:tRNA pseudouridine(55) synthase TruB [Nocardioidaceae bacterium]|nr:tRNA pseudouridine(55) synthase TruB [Nocardioidaceae bacterium]